MSDQDERNKALHRAASSAQNLLPSAFKLAADPNAHLKDRWAAFDQLYDFVVEDMAKQGTPLQPNEFKTDGLTAEQAQLIASRSVRHAVAAMVLTLAYGTTQGALLAIIWQAEVLVPASPDPETWKPPLTGIDQVVLYDATTVMRDEMPDDWRCFFMAVSEPVERRRRAFLRLYGCIGGVWREYSDFARSISVAQRQAFVVFALLCHVPKDEWTYAEFEELVAELLPVEEPDWDELRRNVES